MKIKPEQLNANLKNALLPCYLISGDDPFLKEESLQCIRNKAIKAGYKDRTVIALDQHTPWQSLMSSVLEVSLFSNQKLIELHCQSGKLTQTIKTKLEELFALTLSNTMLLIKTPKLDSATSKNKWYKSFDKMGLHVEIWPIDERQFPAWTKNRLKKAGLPTSSNLVEALVTLTAGNLLATQQEIEKLSLLSLPETALIQCITDSACYTSFDLVSQALAGNLKRAHIILNHLQADGVEPILVLWALTQEIRLSAKIATQMQQGKAFSAVCQAFYVWPKRRPPIERYLKKHHLAQVQNHLQKCASVDKTIKGYLPGNTWFALLQLISSLCGVAIPCA